MRPDAPEHFTNRELSWLDFNFRVLAEAETEGTPLAERLKFLAITSNNLDEFFMVRVAMAHRALDARAAPLGPDGLNPRQLLRAISEKAHEMKRRQYACLAALQETHFAQAHMAIVRPHEYSAEDRDYLSAYFEEQIYPVLTPLAIDNSHPFPLVTNCAVYVLFKTRPHEESDQAFYGQTDTVLVQVPTGLSRIVRLPGAETGVRVALLEDIICAFSASVLRGYVIEGAYPFRVTRDADLAVDDEQAPDLMLAIEKQLRHRRRGAPVRLEIEVDTSSEIIDYLQQQLELEEADTYHIPGILDLRCLFDLVGQLDAAELFDPSWPPQPHPQLCAEQDLFAIMRETDLLLHHPYHSFDPVIQMVNQAADDPSVLAIKITLYRVSGRSPIVAALMRAAESGKQVTVLVELRARFDEEANITWARRLDDAGAHVLYGVVGFKTHSKVLLIVRREQDGIRRYVHLSTGNYNDRTARLYTDLGYFTTRPAFGADVSAFFNVITGYSLPPRWNRIEMAPTGMRRRFLALIDREIEKHTPETPGFIRAKINSLVDPAITTALYRASQAGVRVELVVRGLCSLRVGIRGLSDNIRVISILDRFLEHSRIYHFHNGGQDELYCASADWMERNLDRRLELMFPILDPKIFAQVQEVLDAAFADNVKAWELQPDTTYRRIDPGAGVERFRSQEVLYKKAKAAVAARQTERKEGVLEVKRKPR